jgi:MerC mercury resistance protein
MGLHTKSAAEKVGFWLTVICGIHCLATPILITILPILGSKFEAFHKYETFFLYISLFLAAFLMWKDKKIHNNPWPFEMIIMAMCITPFCYNFFGNAAEIFVSISTSILIISAYWINWKHKEKCHCERVH